MKIELGKTNRGFACGEFLDRYGEKCSIQKSSIATEDCIWLGVDTDEIKTMVRNKGWITEKLGRDQHVSTRMHLTREMAAALIPLLQTFVDTGELVNEQENKG